MSKTTKTAATHSGTCAVCFGEFKLDTAKGRTNKPTRHGFSAHNVRVGQNSGWHTGPCFGYAFPHYGESSLGTQEALKQALLQQESLKQSIATHATRPTLIWVRKAARPGAWQQPNPAHVDLQIEVKDGDKEEHLQADADKGFRYFETKPDYNTIWARNQTALVNALEKVEGAITFYTDKITTWKLAPATVLKPAVVVVHLDVLWKGGKRGEVHTGKCSQWSMRHTHVEASRLTTDPTKVTCQRCKKA